LQKSELTAKSQQTEIGEKRELSAESTEWKTVAAWMDTEGYLYTKEGRRRRYELVIKQTEAEPLKAIQRFLQEQGIVGCKVKWRSRTESFIIREDKKLQFEKYKSRRKRTPRRGPRPKPFST